VTRSRDGASGLVFAVKLGRETRARAGAVQKVGALGACLLLANCNALFGLDAPVLKEDASADGSTTQVEGGDSSAAHGNGRRDADADGVADAGLDTSADGNVSAGSDAGKADRDGGSGDEAVRDADVDVSIDVLSDVGDDGRTAPVGDGGGDADADRSAPCLPGRVTHLPHDIDMQMRGLTVDADGNLWAVEQTKNSRQTRLVKITPQGEFTNYPLPTANAFAQDLVLGADGNVWFTEQVAMQIGRVDKDGKITEFPLPKTGSWPRWITAGKDGFVWFARGADLDDGIKLDNPDNGDSLGYIDPKDTTVIREFPVAPRSELITNLIVGPDKFLWFGEALRIGKMQPSSGQVTWYKLPVPPYLDANNVIGLTVGRDNRVYFTGGYADNKIGSLDGNGTFYNPAEIPTRWADNIVTGSTLPMNIITASDGTLWFVEYAASQLGHFNPVTRVFVEYPLGAQRYPADVVEDHDGNIWVTEFGGVACFGTH